MPFVALAAAACIGQFHFNIVDIELKNRQPSAIFPEIVKLSTKDTKVFVIDQASLIRIYGPKTESEKIKSYVQLMDVKPQYIAVSASAVNSMTKTESSFEVKTSNGSIVHLSDTGSDLQVSLTPNIRKDKLVTMAIEISCGGTVTTNIMACKLNKVYEYGFGPKMLDANGNETAKLPYIIKIKVSLPK